MRKINFLSSLLFINFIHGINSIKLTVPETQVLQRIDVPNTTYQEGMGIVHYLPNQVKPPQSQSGPELIYVMEGKIYYIVNNKPEKIIEQGQSYQIPPGVIHYSRAGSKGATVIAAWVLNKNTPFTKPEKIN